jgi:Putative prokaryotic signal transducing protein
MKRVYSGKDPLMIGHLKNVLETFGIRCITKKSDLSCAAGELPPIECWPELWVEDAQCSEAQAILKKTLAPLNSVKKPWKCDECGEEIEGQFTECWKCGQSRSFSRRESPLLRATSGSLRHR